MLHLPHWNVLLVGSCSDCAQRRDLWSGCGKDYPLVRGKGNLYQNVLTCFCYFLPKHLRICICFANCENGRYLLFLTEQADMIHQPGVWTDFPAAAATGPEMTYWDSRNISGQMIRQTAAGQSSDGGEHQDGSTWRGSQQCRSRQERGPRSRCGVSGGDSGGICIIIEGHGEKMTRWWVITVLKYLTCALRGTSGCSSTFLDIPSLVRCNHWEFVLQSIHSRGWDWWRGSLQIYK